MSRFAILATVLSSIVFVSANPTPVASSLTALRRRTSQQVAMACFSPANPGDACDCPIDLNGGDGVLINVYPGYQCAYPGGACTWNDKDGSLMNTAQTNCPSSAPCPASGCACPTDNNSDDGVLINSFTGYQCAYPNGACTWDFDGNLQNTQQTNCPTQQKCTVLVNH